ncbi:LAQU0S02e02256g1_1 [Lachancea quebecensis]|uniref:LAQU0S02e02256g1_1 n=1 Tax=Lachancea quebecensis TaxID=1654605 RepID=A0A0P1KNG3_9SACH|nr:LAQU0S02e02256g1_1 [Lachancea quebecensis]
MSSEAVKNEDISLKSGNSSLIGAMTAGGRSMVYQLTSFYLRTPVKLFRPARFDYLHYLRVLLVGEDRAQTHNEKAPQSRFSKFWNPRYFYYLENSSIGLLTKGLNKYGWKVIPERVLPPLVANSVAGVVLYTTYLTTLDRLDKANNPECSTHRPWDVMRAGFLAGAAQALASAPIDAIYTRSTVDQLISHAKTYDNLWVYGFKKLKEIGLVGCFGGFGLSLVKECTGFAAYFTIFEVFKGQICQWTIDFIKHYRELKFSIRQTKLARLFQEESEEDSNNLKPVFMSAREESWFRKAFVFVGGVSAALLLQIIQYPFAKLQKMHLSRLEVFDMYVKAKTSDEVKPLFSKDVSKPNPTKIKLGPKSGRLFHIYYHSYLDTFQHLSFIQKNTGSTVKWLYKGFTRNTLAIIPGTTAGLLLLEVMRNKLSENVAGASPQSPKFQN